ncbi:MULTISPECIES: multidrug transporter subunit MdtD [unclassified Photobacterium]|uniref:multidrug transporter subunit MdtD n=1 Tax=unclassified Photobacterium TaxID=2628852 RepID=UPI000D168C6B|nr:MULTISPECIES: multidrug transporter subunit MdtD [unclassified Photobacterium]PSV28616.1 MFS transporter [Photobacterium sp. GB-72]PSV53830.1 MFS transporter [Photobacterium sp. GB-1]PSW73300.1 MFS transporter [Photobacterium sp. GB-50]
MVKPSKQLTWLPWIAGIAFFMQTLDATIINTAIPSLAKSLHESPLTMQLTIISYTLTVAILIPISGWLADRFGTRIIFGWAVGLFTLGSLACGLSGTLTQLVLARILQGVGGAMMVPVARLALLRSYPRNEFVHALNLATMPGLIGPVVGPVLGGVLVTYASWHWIFLINIPVGIIGLWMTKRYMPNFTSTASKFDGWGFILFSSSLITLLSGIELLTKSETALIPVITLLIGFTLLVTYIYYASKKQNVLIPLSLFKTRTFSVGIGGNIFSRLGTGAIPFLIPLMLQVGMGASALYAGLMMVPLAFGALLGKSYVERTLKRLGYRKTLFWVTIVIGIITAAFALISGQLSLWLALPLLFALGIVRATQFTAMNTITLADLDDNHASAGNSMLAVTQLLSISFGLAICACVLHFFSTYYAGNDMSHFHQTFIAMGLLTVISAVSFLSLKRSDGNNLIHR